MARGRSILTLLLCASVAMSAGCRSAEPSGQPHAYRATEHAIPTVHESVSASTIVVGTFDNPATASVRWRSIGAGVAADLARTLRAKTGMQVWADTGLARSAVTLTTRGVSNREPWLESLRRRHPGVNYVVIGQVTDFIHTSDVPHIASSRDTRNRALVAIDFTAIEVATGRILSQNQIVGSAREGDAPASEQYNGVAFGSYLFWRTPLGLATRQAIDRAAGEIARGLPLVQGEAVVSAVRGDREVTISGGSRLGLRVGQEMYLSVVRGVSGEPVALRDADTRVPLTVRITQVGRDSAEAWVSGLCANPTQLRGARLSTTPPAEPSAEQLADDAEDEDRDAAEVATVANVTPDD